MRKKLAALSLVSLLAVTSIAVAGGPTVDDTTPVINGSGFTLGANYATWGENDFALMAGFVNHWFSVSVGGGFERNNNTLSSTGISNLFELRGELGLRQMLEHSLFFTYGVTGSKGYRSPKNTDLRTQPYQLGGYIGLDYQPLRHLLLTAQILPYSYAQGSDRVTRSHVFSEGTFAVAYVFN